MNENYFAALAEADFAAGAFAEGAGLASDLCAGLGDGLTSDFGDGLGDDLTCDDGAALGDAFSTLGDDLGDGFPTLAGALTTFA